MRHGTDGLPWPVVLALFAITWAVVIGLMFAARRSWRRPAKPWRLPPQPQPREDTRPYAAMDGVTIGYSDDPGDDPGVRNHQ